MNEYHTSFQTKYMVVIGQVFSKLTNKFSHGTEDDENDAER